MWKQSRNITCTKEVRQKCRNDPFAVDGTQRVLRKLWQAQDCVAEGGIKPSLQARDSHSQPLHHPGSNLGIHVAFIYTWTHIKQSYTVHQDQTFLCRLAGAHHRHRSFISSTAWSFSWRCHELWPSVCKTEAPSLSHSPCPIHEASLYRIVVNRMQFS